MGSSQTSQYRAIILPSGQLKILSNAQQNTIVRYGLFYDNWKELRNFSELGLQADGKYLSKAPLYPGEMTVKTRISLNGTTANMTIEVTPSRTISANSSHINIRFDDAFWAGSNFTAGSWGTTFPRRLDQTTQSFGRTASNFIVANPNGLTVNVGLVGTHGYALRDSRPANVGWELRAQESGGAWPAWVTKTYVVNISPNIAMELGPDAPVTVTPSASWVPLDHKLRILAGSALDWSQPNPQPAGSSGWLKANTNGRFYFENNPNSPVKFFGTNISGSAIFLDPTVIDSMVDQLWKLGYNSVRLHHMDESLITGSPNSTTLNPFYLTRFHYFVEALRRKGMYVAIDLNSRRIPRPNEILSGSLNLAEYKLLTLCHTGARQNLLTYSLNLFNSVSPFTGRMLKDEPTVAWVDIVNEQTPLTFPRGSLRSEVFDLLEAASGRPWGITTDEDARTADMLQGQLYDWMKTQLRNNGVKALFTMLNQGEHNAFSRTRKRMDFQTIHYYYAHPRWLQNWWELPFSQTATPPLKMMQDYGRNAASRIHKKPLVVEESDAVAPSPYRGEWGLILGAMGAVQQWDAIWRFGYTDRIQFFDELQPTFFLQTLTDPAGLATERAVKALFHRGDLVASEAPTLIYVPEATAGFGDNRHVPLAKNGSLYTPMALSHTNGESSPGTPIMDGISRRADNSVVADLYGLSLRINTANTCGIIDNPTPGPVSAGRLTATLEKARASLWVSSIDGLPLASSRRMLMVHLPEVQNLGTTWTGYERSHVTSLGTLPHLVRDASALVRFSTPRGFTGRVFRLDMEGRRVAVVPIHVNKSTGEMMFTLTTRNPQDGKATIFYEIVT
jgi:hypothetical protein